MSALDTIESLKPSTVVAGHKRPGQADAPSVVAETRQYIRDFDRIAADTPTAEIGRVKSLQDHQSGNPTNQDLAGQSVAMSLLTRNNFRLARDSGTELWRSSALETERPHLNSGCA
jgi:hypothetical protein